MKSGSFTYAEPQNECAHTYLQPCHDPWEREREREFTNLALILFFASSNTTNVTRIISSIYVDELLLNIYLLKLHWILEEKSFFFIAYTELTDCCFSPERGIAGQGERDGIAAPQWLHWCQSWENTTITCMRKTLLIMGDEGIIQELSF